MKIIFMGTPEFAVPSLEMLINEGYNVIAVVTQPDKPKGRGKKLAAPPVKEFALEHGIKVLQPAKIKTPEFVEQIRELGPDLLITAAYGKIISKDMLDVPPLGCINVHGSLLPAYRGAAPIHWSIINGEKVTGITTMFTDVGLDTGDMLLKRELEISSDMTAGELHDEMAILGAEVLKDTLIHLKNGTLVRSPQDDALSSYAPIITKEVGLIDWNKTVQQVHNLVRGTNPWPGAFTFINESKMRVWKTCIVDFGNSQEHCPGEIVSVDDKGILVKCCDGYIMIKELQFDSSKRMKVRDYIRGNKIDTGEKLGK
ncbi:methionyl-tRNA formyltransferase [Ruminiclostridium cellulolyticum]|uniref:Methionyl-tRNA formyltransferase n=1 Tax=Ruminiclostridium cellulolyticum (strain ATCC 35319 / DSM 5812 / JCM 6584 / H10) TaxID=394503 RepID=FMT_RUMCH|nr:methionyl-tRNA formyltransferase [Ruminiclostridium cellulolyticum]B8I255.1 RecName: Full=Methionyl-tRNA formyltransferase [Ruminiclostridium cellulolyticum H10]ACL75881.1 methionyl-tRNA formyltransferase [Ruminiclostridium cellulolyticum H10]